MQTLKSFLINILVAFIPLKKYRLKTRKILKRGVSNYLSMCFVDENKAYENNLSVCAIAKNEGSYFREWIEYHRLVGVEKFYIYDNESSDNTKEVLQPYVEKGIVEYIYYPGQKLQVKAYNDCIKKVRNKTKWLAFIDLDEFIVPIEDQKITDILKKLPTKVNQLMMGWMLYGSSGHEKRPKGLVIKNYKYRQKDRNKNYKAIVKPIKTLYASAHISDVIPEGSTFDSSLDNFPYNEAKEMPFDVIRVNHYHCKSWEEYSKKAPRGDALNGAKFGENKYTKAFFDGHDKNDILDPIMDRYVDKIKAVINK